MEATIADILAEVKALRAEQARMFARWLSPEDAAAYLFVSRATVDRLVGEGRLNASRPTSGSVRLDREELDRYMTTVARRIKGKRGRG